MGIRAKFTMPPDAPEHYRQAIRDVAIWLLGQGTFDLAFQHEIAGALTDALRESDPRTPHVQVIPPRGQPE